MYRCEFKCLNYIITFQPAVTPAVYKCFYLTSTTVHLFASAAACQSNVALSRKLTVFKKEKNKHLAFWESWYYFLRVHDMQYFLFKSSEFRIKDIYTSWMQFHGLFLFQFHYKRSPDSLGQTENSLSAAWDLFIILFLFIYLKKTFFIRFVF